MTYTFLSLNNLKGNQTTDGLGPNVLKITIISIFSTKHNIDSYWC